MKRSWHLMLLLSLVVFTAGCPSSGGGLYGGGNDNTDDGGGNDGVGDGVERNFTAELSGDQEAPPVTTNGTGSGTFTLNADQTELSFNVTVTGLSGPVRAAHFHSSPPGVSGGVVFDIGDGVDQTDDGTVTAVGAWPVSDDQVTALLDGDIYVNFHTTDNPDGEVRGQLILE